MTGSPDRERDDPDQWPTASLSDTASFESSLPRIVLARGLSPPDEANESLGLQVAAK